MDFEERRRGWVQTDLTENSKTKTSFLKVRKTDMADATHICTELNTKILKNNYNPDIHVRPFDCGSCFMETATVLDTPSSSLSVPIFYLTSRNFYHASQIFILHLACQIFYFACHIFISHFAFFISHLVLLSRISHVTFSIWHLAFSTSHLGLMSHLASRIFYSSYGSFLSRISHFFWSCNPYFLSRRSHFYLELNLDFLKPSKLSFISHISCRLPWVCENKIPQSMYTNLISPSTKITPALDTPISIKIACVNHVS